MNALWFAGGFLAGIGVTFAGSIMALRVVAGRLGQEEHAARRRCQWCGYAGGPVDVLAHEAEEHGA